MLIMPEERAYQKSVEKGPDNATLNLPTIKTNDGSLESVFSKWGKLYLVMVFPQTSDKPSFSGTINTVFC